MSSILSIISPLTARSSSCGYCGPPGERSTTKSNHHEAKLIPTQLSCEAYQAMIDRGWRRSGTHCYKPDLKRSCCPQYTIRLDALQFKTSKSQRKLVNRFNRFVFEGDSKHDGDQDTDSTRPSKTESEKSNEAGVFALATAIHASEYSFFDEETKFSHKFEVTLEPSSYTPEKFALYQSYQKRIHQETKTKTPDSFSRFLVETSLSRENIPYPSEPPKHLPREYGSYHQLYRIDGELIAVGVIDILPNCVSSVYFMYEKKWEKLSLGKLSALREASLTKQIHDAGVPGMQYLYMGFYIHSCPKMRYKGDYSPSYLADPEEWTWHSLDTCQPLLDKYRYATFAHPENSISGPFNGGAHDPQIPEQSMKEIQMVKEIKKGTVTVISVVDSPQWPRPSVKNAITTCASALGLPLAKSVIFYLAYVL